LVHLLDVVRKPRGHPRARGDEHVRGHPSRRRARLLDRASDWRRARDRALRLARPGLALGCGRRCRSARGHFTRRKDVMNDELTSRRATAGDAVAIARIYNEGIEDRTATFRADPVGSDVVAAWFDDDFY